jgi:choline dehydrogenase
VADIAQLYLGYVACRKEVVICAGTLATPKLLMLSGIGPKTLLEKHGIPVQVDLPGKQRPL